MLKYKDTLIGFREVPDEISLCINITGCPIHCPDCHSKWLWENNGINLTVSELHKLIESNKGISCVCLMGGDQDPTYINSLARAIRAHDSKLKVCWYSGKSLISPNIDICNFDFIKLGKYMKEFGGLDNKYTNQRFFKVSREHKDICELIDITNKFWHD